jgi:hypothetical protein
MSFALREHWGASSSMFHGKFQGTSWMPKAGQFVLSIWRKDAFLQKPQDASFSD